MKKFITIVLCFAVYASFVFAQTKTNADPNQAKFVTSDVDNFWRAFDLAAKETDREKKINVYQTEYLDKGSAGLQDFVRLRIKSAKDLVAVIETLPRFYASVRPSTLRVAETEKQMRKSFRKFKKLYPNAVFPDVYFVIGISDTGGTASKNGLLIGTELYGLTKETPRDEFPTFFKTYLPGEKDEAALQKLVDKALATALKPIEKVPFVVAHESCHFNQNYPPQKTVLEKSIQEGACDFIAELIAGEPLNPEQKIYGDRHEAVLWREFQAEMNGTDLSKWMYNGFKSKDRPGDLGYYMGYKISKSYYENAADKRQAISDVLNVKDFAAFFERSRYREKFAETSNVKANQLPEEINSVLNEKYPGWRLSQLGADVEQFFVERFPSAHHNYIKGDFDGNKQTDYALLIEHSNFDESGKSFTHVVEIVAFLRKSNEYNLYVLEESSPANLDLYLTLAKKDKESSDFYTEKKFKYPNDSISVSHFEKAGGTYIFEKGKFRYVYESD